MTRATERFADRVDDYVRHRPSYPGELVDAMLERLGVGEGGTLVDLGSGTGISSRLLVARGRNVVAVEPNEPMRRAAESALGGDARFRSVAASAEATTLADASIDGAVAFQSFHWFDAARCRDELRRILRPGGRVALVWNERLVDTPFLVAYEELLQRRSPDYAKVEHRNAYEKIAAFFAPTRPIELAAPNEQSFDREGLFGRVLSSSYVPKSGPDHDAIVAELDGLFAEHQSEGVVAFRYLTKAFVGPLDRE